MIDLAMTDKIREAVRVELARRDWTQSDLAERIGKSKQYVNSALRGSSADMPDIWQKVFDELGLELIVRPKEGNA